MTSINFKKITKIIKGLLLFVLIYIASSYVASERAMATSFETDAGVKNLAANSCGSGGRTIHASYAANPTVSDRTVYFDLRSFSYRCPNSSTATNVHNDITNIDDLTSYLGGTPVSMSNIKSTLTSDSPMYTGLTLASGQYTPVVSRRFSLYIPNNSETHTFKIYFFVRSFSSENYNNGNRNFQITDYCTNFAGVQLYMPSGYTRINGNCYRAPTISSLTVSCSGNLVTVSYSASDADGDLSYVTINPNGVTPSGTRTYGGSPGGDTYTFGATYGSSYSVSARAYDSVGLSSSSTSRTYACSQPPPAVSCSFIAPTRAEVGTAISPVLRLSRTDSGTTALSVSFSARSSYTGTTNLTASPISPQTLTGISNRDITFINLPPTPDLGSVTFTASISWSGGSATCPTYTVTAFRRPTFTISNGDLLVGAKQNISGTCTGSPTGNVYGWADTIASKGANASYAAKIVGKAVEFYSGSKDAGKGTNKKYLTLSNSVSTDTWGGNFSTPATNTECMEDIYANTIKDSAVTIGSSHSLDTSIAGDQAKITGNLTLSSPATFAGKRAIYVTGNVYISSNIILSTSYANRSAIPFFALIVKGNIYINKDVTQLDGMYVAQPNGASGGSIFTCAKNNTTSSYSLADVTSSTTYRADCSKQLTINGIVQAKDIKLHRTFGSLNAAPSSPAEIFNGLPSLHYAEAPFKDLTPTTRLDSALSLPPLIKN